MALPMKTKEKGREPGGTIRPFFGHCEEFIKLCKLEPGFACGVPSQRPVQIVTDHRVSRASLRFRQSQRPE